MTTVHTLDPSRAAAWDAFAAAHPNGTFFHRAAWAGVIRRAFRHTPHYLVAERDGTIVGILPLVQVKTLLFGNSLISNPFCVYGGPLGLDPEAVQALDQAATALMTRLGVPTMEWRLRDPQDPTLQNLGPAWQSRDDLYVTFRKPITADNDANMKAIPRKQRAMVRKGLDRGLTATTGRDIKTLHAVYAESVRNLGTPVFARRYFQLLADTFADDMDVIIVRDGSTPIAAVLNFYDRGEVLPYYGGGTTAARTLAGHDFLYWSVMHNAAARGCTGFDFGRSKIGTGSFAFKKNWGFPPAPLALRYRLAEGAAIPDHNPLNPKYRLMIATWKRLPLPIANLVGPHVVRGVG